MNNLKIALCQMNVIDNKDFNIKNAIDMIIKSKKKGANFVVLPEMFNCPYDNEKFIEYCESEENSYTLDSIGEIAKKEDIYILAGSIPIRNQKGKLFNTSFLFDKNGEIIAKHEKIHLFDIDIKDKIYYKESDVLEAGNNITVVNTEFGKIGVGICYDIRFPELARLMTLKGAEILIYPGAFNLTTGPAHWELLFRSRALDNQVFSIGVAPALNKNANYNSYGHSIIVNPWGEVIAEAEYDEEIILAEIDLVDVKNIREELPLLKNRRTDIYDLKLK